MIIAIDGPVATGKSTVAKKLAQSIGFIFFDTGAMYRTLTYGIIKHQVNLDQPDQLERFLEEFQFDIKVINREKKYYFEDEDITQRIRETEVTRLVSEVSAILSVRDKLIAIQRELSRGINAVFEGRDMGTVVFPNAALKIFLTGKREIRAKRRYEELKNKYRTLTLEECLEDLDRRDLYDSTRACSPLSQAPDAYVIDTSDLTVDEVVDKILEYKDALKTKRNANH